MRNTRLAGEVFKSGQKSFAGSGDAGGIGANLAAEDKDGAASAEVQHLRDPAFAHPSRDCRKNRLQRAPWFAAGRADVPTVRTRDGKG